MSFLALIGIGSLALLQPFCVRPGQEPLGVADSLFVSTSAVCVTGLSPIDVGAHLSGVGQVVLLLLIQMGGLGFLTLSTGLLLSLGIRSSMLNQTALVTSLSARGGGVTLRKLVRLVFLTTGTIELAGASILAVRFHQVCGFTWDKALWYGVFHSVSAFCNAGFSLFSVEQGDHGASFAGFVGDWPTNLTLIALILLGGLGFLVIEELLSWTRSGSRHRLGLHTRIVLSTSVVLLVGGAVVFFILEHNNPDTLGGLPASDRALASLFQSVTARTAGFNTVEIGALRSQTLLLMMLLMLVGGSPASCAGGIKTTTVFVLFVLVVARLRARRNPTAFGREIGPENVTRAVTLALAAVAFVGLICAGVMFLQTPMHEHCAGGFFMDLLFESVSAFGTVGLSTGVTETLGLGAKLTLACGMFIGRVGPLTLFVRLVEPPREDRVRLPDEPVVVG